MSNLGGGNGDSITMSGTASNAVVTLASSSGGSGGPPAGLQSAGRSMLAIGGVNVTPLYYVGVTSFNPTPTQITFSQFNLGVPNLPPGTSLGLAHNDPSLPQNGWNQHCAFGPSQVTVNGSNATFTPNAPITTYFGAPVWFAVYQYPSSVTSAPTPPPPATPTAPTVTTPSSLTGTYVGSSVQTSPAGSPQYLEFSLTQSGTSVSGTFAVLPNGSQTGGFGTLSGSLSGSALALTGTNTFGNTCTNTINATASGALILGTFAVSGGSGCTGSGTFSAQLQTFTVPSVAGNYSGTVTQVGTSGTMTMTITQSGAFFSGSATLTFPSNPSMNGSGQFVGFISNATTAQFTVLPGGGNQSCAPFGTVTINGNQLTASFSGSSTGNGNCNGTGTFTVTHS